MEVVNQSDSMLLNPEDQRPTRYSQGNFGRAADTLTAMNKRRCLYCLLGLLVVLSIIILFMRSVVFLQPDDQLVVQGLSDKWVVNGPGLATCFPLTTSINKRKAIKIDQQSFHIVTDTLSAKIRVEAGPQLLFLNAFDEASDEMQKFVLTNGEYLRLLDDATGNVRVEVGPSTVTPRPYEKSEQGKQAGASLTKTDYVKLSDKSGEVRIVKGPGLIFPRATESLGEKQQAYKLERDEWMKLVDEATGVVRVAVGEQIVVPGETEHVAVDIQQAIKVDDETAVLVQNKKDGQQRLVKAADARGPFFPSAYDEILEKRSLIRIEPHEVAIAADENNHILYFDGSSGDAKGLAFFLPPYYHLITMMWGSGTSEEDLKSGIVRNSKEVKFKVPVTKIDTRRQYAFFEYKVRTSDKVELLLEGTLVWQVVDVPKMFSQTSDPKGDVWYHARQRLVQAVSRVTLETFMDDISDLAAKAIQTDPFYEERGVNLHELSIIRYECANPSDAQVLEQIIAETTKRMNQLASQNSKNDVERAAMEGDIAIENQRTEFLKVKASNDKVSATAEGEADGLRLAASVSKFVQELGDHATIPNASAAVELLKFYEEQRTSTTQTKDLASGKAQLFLTPKDLNLKMVMGRDEL